MSKYLALLLLSLSIPFILSFWPPLKFWRHWRCLLLSLCLILFIFGSWDIFATWRGHWAFASSGIHGPKVFNLPFEEALFFIIIPFCCIFTWEALKYLRSKFR